MKRNQLLIGLVVVSLLSGAGYGVYRMGVQQGMTMGSDATKPAAATDTPTQAGAGAIPQSVAEGEEATRRHIEKGIKAGDVDPATGRKVLYYHDPMVPGNKFDKPAKSPFMDMMLVPVYADSDGDDSKVTVSPRIQQNLGIRTAAVTEGLLSPQVSAVGNIAFNERDQALVQARATGYIERLHVRATLDRVRKGQALAELYVPDWIAAQEEFLSVRRMQGTDLAMLVDAARQRMRQVGMSEEQIRLVENSGKTQPRITLTAPIGGVVVELTAREGMTVMPGATLFRINGLSSVWAEAQVPESQAALIRPGTKVQAHSAAAPGTALHGTVQAILPEVNAATRTLKARVELANPGNVLVPGMFVTMQFMDMRAETSLLIPTEAVIQTGKRVVVMLAEEKGKFRPVEVEIGIESNGQTSILRGLQAGQRVVVSSQFLIDSEASLKGIEARLNDAPKPGAANTAPRHEGEAKIEAIGKDSITLSHGPIASLKWGAMTMDFKLPASGKPRNLEQGDKVSFEFYMDAEGLPQLIRISPMASEAKAMPAKATVSKP
ncbi:efflux RND transporter periplasmic adaptor subunit [Rhodoferax ferrireducens]|uniref:efflux RND transporter periplasmic adaptor subunit n=1 Tax=Rhodoferax ferrireducens TaxID=192843 RepID=UPI000E0D23A7|nr:efflux RND transporter periplasmic adaptor subunit [Rhodoferax ferrireducens]